jgi:DNA mismatch repair protein MSH5
MDTHIGDLHPSIVGKIFTRSKPFYLLYLSIPIDREIEIIQELQNRILVHDLAMEDACDACAELDVLLSFAEASRANDYRRPRMVNESIIDIIGGRCASTCENIS